MEGLEISENSFAHTLENKNFRIDSQFFTQEPIKNPKLKYDKIGNCLVNAQYGISISMNEEGIGYPIYRMNEIHSMMCDLEVDKHAEISNAELTTFELNNRDVLFNRTNSFEWVGRTGVYRKLDDRKFVFASYLVRFIPDESKIMPEYLAAFLNTKAGIVDIKRRARQSINQTNVNPEEVKAIEIPLLSIPFQRLVKDCFDQAHSLIIKSKESYQKAENLLLQEIGLVDFKPSQEPVNIKSFKESFGISGRLDAEYYQLKYDQLEERIQKTESFVGIKEIRTDNSRGLQPQYVKNGKLDIINSKHILEQTLDYENFEKTTLNYWDEQERSRVFKDDILTYTTGANIGRTQVYLLDKKALASNHVNILRLKKGFNPFYVGFVMNSFVGKLQTEKLSAGSAQAELYPKDIDNFLIPIIDKDKQQQIAELVEESFSLKKQSEHLLEVAKRAVEIAIEEDEQVAMEWITEQTKEI